jgi:methylated-DNA-[protein]-cysteine S-methyltransferase
MSASTLDGRRTHAVVASPVGPITLVATGGALAGLYLDRQRYAPTPGSLGVPDPGPSAEAARQLEEYFSGERTAFELELALDGTSFQRLVWSELLAVPYGDTVTYGELARRIGQPTASRAVGLANGKNPVAIIVPCHRVVGTDGNLTGYGGGLDRKRFLIDLEQRVSGQAW